MRARTVRHTSPHLPNPARIAAFTLLLAALLAPSMPCIAQGASVAPVDLAAPLALANADLEEGFETARGGQGSVASGWTPWWVEGSDEEMRDGLLRRPTYAPEAELTSPHGAHSRALAQRVSTLHATHVGGIYQRVTATPGSVVRFAMWVYVWSSSADDVDRSAKPGDYRVAVGIDPYGGADATSDRVVWSPEMVQYDEWIKLAVSATAQGDAITVFTRGACSWRVKHNVAIWDDATLALTAAPQASAAPVGTGAPPAPMALELASANAAPSTRTGVTPNVLVNPDLEEGFSERGAGEVSIALGWEPWWEPGSEAQTSEGFLFRPEYKPERREAGRGRVHSMSAAQKQFNTYATHRAGIYQRVPVSPGGRVTFAMWAYVWSSAEDDPEESVHPGDYRVSVGIDPTGGTDGAAASVVWSPSRHAYDRWVELTVSAVAQGAYVTVFTRGEPGWRVKHNDSYWDDATLTVTGGSMPSLAGVSSTGLVPGKARVLSSPADMPPLGAAAALGAPAPPTRTPYGGPVISSVRPPVGGAGGASTGARAAQPLGQEASLSYAGASLSLTWERRPEGVTLVVQAPNALEAELTLYHERQETARWAIVVMPSDPLTIEWSGIGLDGGELGVEVRDSRDGVLARCGTLP